MRLAITLESIADVDTLTALVRGHHDAGELGVEVDRHVGVGGVAHRLHHELREVHLFGLQPNDAGIEP